MSARIYRSILPSPNGTAGKRDLFGKYLQKKEQAATQTSSSESPIRRLDTLLINIHNYGENFHLLKMTAEQESPTRLWHYVELSKTDSRIRFAATNAISALNISGAVFSGRDLSNIRVPGANLSGGLFHRTNFTGADLQQVNFQLAYLENAVFARANLQGVNFGQSQLQDPQFESKSAVCVTAQGNLIAIGEAVDSAFRSKSKIYVLEFQDLICTCEQDAGFREVAFTADGLNLVSAGGDGRIKIWNAKSGELLYTLAPNYVLRREIEEKFPRDQIDTLERANCIKPAPHYPDYVEVSLDREVFERGAFSNLVEILTFFGEKIGIRSCAVSSSPDEPLVACIRRNGDICIWDFKSLRLISIISGEAASGNLVFLADGNHLLFRTEVQLKLLHITTKEVTKTWFSQYPNYHCVCLSSDEKMIAACGFEGVIVWSFDEPQPVKILYHAFAQERMSPDSGCIPDIASVVAFSNNGRFIAVGTRQEIQIWNTSDWKLEASFGGKELTYGVKGLQFLQNDEYLLSIMGHENPKIWKITNKFFRNAETHAFEIESISISFDGNFLISLSGHILRIWNAGTGDFLWRLEERVEQFVVSRNSSHILLRSENKVMLWDLQTREQVAQFNHERKIEEMAFLPSGRIAILDSTMLTTHDLTTHRKFSVLRGALQSLSKVAFSNDGRWLAFGSNEGVLKAWNSETGILSTLRNAHISEISQIHFSGDAIISKSENRLLVWKPILEEKYIIKEFDDVYPITGKPDYFLFRRGSQFGVFVLEGGSFNLIHTLRANVPAPLPRFLGQRDPDMVTMSDDFGRMKQWSKNQEAIYTGSHKSAFSFSTQHALSSLAFHPTLPIVALGGEYGMIQLWNPITGRLLNVLWGQTGSITNLVFSADGAGLFAASSDRTLQLWKFESENAPPQLLWRSKPHSLIVHGLNTLDATFDNTAGKFLFDERVYTNAALGLEVLLSNEESYRTKPHLFPPDDSSYYSDIELKSAYLDMAIMMVHHKILKEEDPQKFLQAIVSLFSPEGPIKALIPAAFHFILKAIHSVAKDTLTRTPVNRVYLCLIYEVLDSNAPDRNPLTVREFLDQKLQAIIRRLSRMLFSVAYQETSKAYEEVGDIFLQEQNRLKAFLCYSKSLENDPNNTTVINKRRLLL